MKSELDDQKPKSVVKGTVKGVAKVLGKGVAAAGRGARWAAPRLASVSKKAMGGARAGVASAVARIRKTDDPSQQNESES